MMRKGRESSAVVFSDWCLKILNVKFSTMQIGVHQIKILYSFAYCYRLEQIKMMWLDVP